MPRTIRQTATKKRVPATPQREKRRKRPAYKWTWRTSYGSPTGTPPPSTPVRFATWFFAGAAGDQAVNIDDGEIKDHQWIRPADALAKHGASEIDLAPPTWVTLYHLSRRPTIEAVLNNFRSREARFYETRAVKRSDGIRVALWAGDAGYEDWDADREGPRHRLVMPQDGFTFENDAVDY